MANRSLLLIIFYVLAFSARPSYSEIYKYQDEKGRWQFTDKPPIEDHEIEVISIDSSHPEDGAKDLLEKLQDIFRPDTPVEEATLAVVTIQTELGSGSGFFLSAEGLIVTNKHVVRVSEKKQKAGREKLDKAEEKLKMMKTVLNQEKKNLRNYQVELEKEERRLEEMAGFGQNALQAELEMYQDRYRQRKKEVEQAEQKFRKLNQNYQKNKSRYRSNIGRSSVANRFKCTLKDGSVAQAELVALSEDHDLALLQLKGYRTPFLQTANQGQLSQGDRVYAIGSPIGKKDYVTSGIIASISQEKIVTDAQILPGNSGGPLINEQGQVVAVNTQKFTQGGNVNAQGFGISISINRVMREFDAYLNNAPTITAVPAHQE